MRDEGAKTTTGQSPGSSLIPHPSSLVGLMGMIGLMGMMNPACSQGLVDPTRPPPGYASGDPEVGVPTGGPVLQSVMISPAGRSAIISGETVRLGQKYRDAVLVRVAENEVVLKGGEGTQVLKLYPGVEKRDVAPPAKSAPRRGKSAPGEKK